jgi:hypothetical protein
VAPTPTPTPVGAPTASAVPPTASAVAPARLFILAAGLALSAGLLAGALLWGIDAFNRGRFVLATSLIGGLVALGWLTLILATGQARWSPARSFQVAIPIAVLASAAVGAAFWQNGLAMWTLGCGIAAAAVLLTTGAWELVLVGAVLSGGLAGAVYNIVETNGPEQQLPWIAGYYGAPALAAGVGVGIALALREPLRRVVTVTGQ